MAALEREEPSSASKSTLLTRPQICHEDRYQGYKTLIQDIAERLGPEDVRSIAFNQDLPDNHCQPTALEVLQQLERHGLFSHGKIQPLADLLKDIHRNDLVNKHIEPYQTRYGRHSSMPESASPNIAVRSRKINRPHSYPSQVRERVNVEEKLGEAVQETGEIPPQASYTQCHVHMPETGGNSLQYMYRLQVATETQSRPQLQTPQQQIPQVSNTHNVMRVTNRPVEAQAFLQPQPQLSEPFEGCHSTPHIPESTGADHSRYSEQATPRTTTPERSQQYMTTSHPSFENTPIGRGIPANSFVPVTAFVRSELLQPQAITTQGSDMEFIIDSDHELPSHGSSQNASQSDCFGYHSSLSGTQEMTPDTTEQHGRSNSDLMRMHTNKPPRRANSYGFGNATYWNQSAPPSNEDLLQAQLEQQFQSSPGFLPISHFRPPNPGYVLKPGYKHTINQSLRSSPSSFERMQFHPKLAKSQTEGLIRSFTPSLSTGNRRTSAPENYLRRSVGSANRIHHEPGFHTPQHIYRTNHSSRSSIAASDSAPDVENLIFPSQRAMGIQNDTSAENFPMQQPSDNQYAETLPTQIHETVETLDSRMRQLQVPSHSNVTKGRGAAYSASEHFDTHQSSLRRPQSGSRLKRFKHRRKSWGPSIQEMQWLLKRKDLNKIVYEHKTEKCLRSPKLELEYAEAKANPKLAFSLYPYGLEEDYGKNATLEIKIKIPTKKCPRLPSSAKVSLTMTAWDCKEDIRLNSVSVEKPMDLRQFTIPEFITHTALKESRSDYIEIQASAELIILTVEPQ